MKLKIWNSKEAPMKYFFQKRLHNSKAYRDMGYGPKNEKIGMKHILYV